MTVLRRRWRNVSPFFVLDILTVVGGWRNSTRRMQGMRNVLKLSELNMSMK